MRKLIAALFMAAIATPAMACTDWPAILALDVIISEQIRSELETAKANGEEPSPFLLKEDAFHKLDVIDDKAAIADNCQEEPK